jgi:hypothetical protein
VLCLASDPGPTERIAGRTLVGNAGQRVQGLLAKLGLTRSYLCLNAWAYALRPSKARPVRSPRPRQRVGHGFASQHPRRDRERQGEGFYAHLAEGRSDNELSRDEFANLVELEALTPATVVIHGTALAREQLAEPGDAGAKHVWSPAVEPALYGETTRAADAFDVGLPVGLGADWLPSGSTSLLAEIKVARRCLADQATNRHRSGWSTWSPAPRQKSPDSGKSSDS